MMNEERKKQERRRSSVLSIFFQPTRKDHIHQNKTAESKNKEGEKKRRKFIVS